MDKILLCKSLRACIYAVVAGAVVIAITHVKAQQAGIAMTVLIFGITPIMMILDGRRYK